MPTRPRRKRSPAAILSEAARAPTASPPPAASSAPSTAAGLPDHGGLSRTGGFKSKAQWRFAFATHKPWAREAAHKTAGGPKVRYKRLPRRKGTPAARPAT